MMVTPKTNRDDHLLMQMESAYLGVVLLETLASELHCLTSCWQWPVLAGVNHLDMSKELDVLRCHQKLRCSLRFSWVFTGMYLPSHCAKS